MAALVFHTISLRNFLSYGNNSTIIALDQVGTTLIVGEDLDNTTNGQGANGVGKSAIINGIAYAMYDRPVSNISKDNLVNNINKKNMEVTVEFTAPNGKRYTIKRNRKMKVGATGNTVHIYEDGKDVTPDSVGRANEYIVKVVGIPYELFVRIVLFSASHTPFLDLPTTSHYAANQRDIIEELFGLTMLTTKADQLKKNIIDTEARLATNKIKMESVEREHERHQTQLASAKKRVINWETTNQTTIAELEQMLATIANVNISEQQQYHKDMDNLKGLLSDELDKQRKTETTIKTQNTALKKLVGELDHLQKDKCPYCLQKYEAGKSKIADIESNIASIETEVAHLSRMAQVIESGISDISKLIKELKAKIVVSNIDELVQIQNQSASVSQKIASLRDAVNPYLEPLDELTATVIDSVNYDEINKITKQLEHEKFLLKLLTKKDSFVRKALLNKNIPYLNQKLAGYLTTLGLPHKVEFTHEMTASISQFGYELDFGNLSAGQQARVNLALSFAFRDVLQNMHTKVNVCMLDEALDHGLDSVGIQAAVKMLKRKARDEKLSMFVITHRDVDSAFEHIMTIQLSKGFSYLKQEDV